MRKNTLGRTGLEVTQVGYGSMGLRGPRTWGVRVVSDEHADRFLNLVLDAGVNLIDTAPAYGACEERIGRFIASRRSEYVLATKCGYVYEQRDDHLELRHVWERDVIRRDLETSLQRLKTDRIDIMQFHGGDAETLQSAGLIDLLLDFQSQGLVGFIGVSSSIPNLEALIELNVFDVIQVPYSCLTPEHTDLMRAAAEKGAGVIVRGGLAKGGPDAEIQRPALNDVWQTARLDELLSDGMTRAELILRHTLSHPACHTTIVGTCNEDHFHQNLAAAEQGPLSPALVAEIAKRVALAIDS